MTKSRKSQIAASELAAYQEWARAYMESRPPDLVIGNDYLRRWHVLPRTTLHNVYLHQTLTSDPGDVMHDHPWASESIIIFGGYTEEMAGKATLRERLRRERDRPPNIMVERREGNRIKRHANTLHRLHITPGRPCVSLFLTGPKSREWGFGCPQGWVHHAEYLARADEARVGGCGET